MSAHERLERDIAITEGRAWLDARPDAVTAADWVAGAWYYPGALVEGADDGDILVAIREPDNPHDENAIALWSAAAQVGHMPAVTAAIQGRRHAGTMGCGRFIAEPRDGEKKRQ